ncbi:MAG: c-type cytochrome [Novosphingobium sp.]|nr:c-type cytochrome [Novosphingobium sp.]
MSSWDRATAIKLGLSALALATIAASPLAGASNLGRPATPAEIAAWDIDVRPDFAGLPAGSGSVEQGMEVWESKCESCHGTFGESNEVFTPLAGGTTRADQDSGRVKSLVGPNVPQRTTLMKLSTVSTLFDYIRRAMPWNAPKSLSDDEVYAVTAYVLYLNDVVSDDFVLDQDSIREVQNRLPNRNGMTRDHGLWEVAGKADTHNTACMKNCAADVEISSSLPEYARDSHGNLADQNRSFGPVRGTTTAASAAPAATTAPTQPAGPSRLAMAEEYGCTGCHAMDDTIVGPGFRQVAQRYADKAGSLDQVAAKIRAGGSGAWGSMPMPAQEQLNEEQARELAEWILSGAN